MITDQVMRVAGQVMAMAIILSVLLLFVGIGMLIFVHVCIVGRALRRGFGNVSVALERGNDGTTFVGNTSMSKDDLEKLPCFEYITKDTAASPVDCAVCLEAFRVGEKCRLLPICKHSFHADCVDAWLLQTPFCPMCRTSADSSKGSGDMSLDMRSGESQTTENISTGRLSDVRIEVGQFGGEMSENNNEFRGNQAMGNAEVGNSVSGVELEERQSNTVRTPLPQSVPELAV